MNIGIKVDGDNRIGMGHLMRSKELANVFRAKGHKVKFLMKYPLGMELVEGCGYEILRIAEHQDSKLEFEEAAAVCKGNGIGMLVIDSYDVVPECFEILKSQGILTTYIDDLNCFQQQADFVVNGNVYGKNLGYEKGFDGQNFLLGSEFFILRDEFRSARRKDSVGNVENILVTTGGTDPHGIVDRIAGLINGKGETFGKIKFHFVLGNGFAGPDEIMDKYKDVDAIVFHRNVKQMSRLMGAVDIAIASSGTTVYELFYMGVPTIAFCMVENQKYVFEEITDQELVMPIRLEDILETDEIIDKLEGLIENRDRRALLSEKTKTVVDGHGAERIYESLMDIFEVGEGMKEARIFLRPIKTDDEEILVKWRNQDRIIEGLFSHRGPTLEEHRRWFARYVEDQSREEFMICLAKSEKPIGTIGLSNIDSEDRKAEYGILIGEPDCLGKGFAREASELILDYGFNQLNLQKIYLKVLEKNEAAVALYKKIGFEIEGVLKREAFKDKEYQTVIAMAVFAEL